MAKNDVKCKKMYEKSFSVLTRHGVRKSYSKKIACTPISHLTLIMYDGNDRKLQVMSNFPRLQSLF